MDSYRDLVMQAQKGSAAAFASLYSEIYQDLYRFALYTLRHVQDAQDVTADTVTDAFAQIRQLRDADSFRAWIFRILTNKCKKQLARYADKTAELPEDLPSSDGDPARYAHVREAFAQLSKEERLILSMHLFAGYTSKETAEILHSNDNTVRSKESRALAKLKALLEER